MKPIWHLVSPGFHRPMCYRLVYPTEVESVVWGAPLVMTDSGSDRRVEICRFALEDSGYGDYWYLDRTACNWVWQGIVQARIKRWTTNFPAHNSIHLRLKWQDMCPTGSHFGGNLWHTLGGVSRVNDQFQGAPEFVVGHFVGRARSPNPTKTAGIHKPTAIDDDTLFHF